MSLDTRRIGDGSFLITAFFSAFSNSSSSSHGSAPAPSLLSILYGRFTSSCSSCSAELFRSYFGYWRPRMLGRLFTCALRLSSTNSRTKNRHLLVDQFFLRNRLKLGRMLKKGLPGQFMMSKMRSSFFFLSISVKCGSLANGSSPHRIPSRFSLEIKAHLRSRLIQFSM